MATRSGPRITPFELRQLQTSPVETTESQLGADLGSVQVHYNSSRPAQLQAHAYAQGTDIHVGPGQEQHLAHEAWHVEQVGGFERPT